MRYDSQHGFLVRFDDCGEDEEDREVWVDEKGEDEWEWAVEGQTLPPLAPRLRARLVAAVNSRNLSKRVPPTFVPAVVDMVLAEADRAASARSRPGWKVRSPPEMIVT